MGQVRRLQKLSALEMMMTSVGYWWCCDRGGERSENEHMLKVALITFALTTTHRGIRYEV